MDQANTLRRLLNAAKRSVVPIFGDMQQNTASALAGCMMEQAMQAGQSCLTIDTAGQGLATQWGLDVRHELLDYFEGRRRLEQVCVPGAGQNWLLPAAQSLPY